MKNEGFTLIKLLIVISILILLFLLIMPKVLSLIEGNEKDSFVKDVQLIIIAATKYMETDEQKLLVPEISGKGVVITMDPLIRNKLIDKKDKYNGAVVVVYNNNNVYEYFAFVSDKVYSINGYRSEAINNNTTLFVSPIPYETLLEDVEDFNLEDNGQLAY